MSIALLSGPQDPSQLESTINSLINSLNGYLFGTSAQTASVVNGTTSANLQAYGVVILASTVAGAQYKLPPPPAIGQSVRLVSKSTLSQTVTLTSGYFFSNRTKLTFKTTNVGVPEAIELVGRSSTIWAISAAAGNVKCT